MNTDQVIASLKATLTDSLLDLLSNALADRSLFDPDFLSLVISELSARELTPGQQNRLNEFFAQHDAGGEYINKPGAGMGAQSLLAFTRATEPRKHTTLKSLVTPLLLFGALAMIFGLVAFIDQVGRNMVLNAFFSGLLGIGLGLLMIAVSQLIKGLIETEYAYRKKQKP